MHPPPPFFSPTLLPLDMVLPLPDFAIHANQVTRINTPAGSESELVCVEMP